MWKRASSSRFHGGDTVSVKSCVASQHLVYPEDIVREMEDESPLGKNLDHIEPIRMVHRRSEPVGAQ